MSFLEEILHKLDEAIESKDWDLVQEVLDEIREHLDNPFDEYSEEEWG